MIIQCFFWTIFFALITIGMPIPKNSRISIMIFLIIFSGTQLMIVGCSAFSTWLSDTKSKFNFGVDYILDITGRFGSIISYSHAIIGDFPPSHLSCTLPLVICQFLSIADLCRRFRQKVVWFDKDRPYKSTISLICWRILIGGQIFLLAARLDRLIDTAYVLVFVPTWLFLTPPLCLSIACVIILPKDLLEEYRRRSKELGNFCWLVIGLCAGVFILGLCTLGFTTYLILVHMYLEEKLEYSAWNIAQLVPLFVILIVFILLVAFGKSLG